MAQTDILIGFRRPLDEGETVRMVDSLTRLPGVGEVRAGRHRHHLLQVFFDPDRQTAGGLLKAASGTGHGARLIGA